MRKIVTTVIALSFIFLPALLSAQGTYFDDSGAQFSTTGSWTVNPNKSGAYLNSHTWSHFLHPSGSGSVPGFATWNTSVAPGEYDVAVRWHLLSNRATDAKYDVVYDNGQVSGQIIIDQTDGSQLDAEGFVSIGTYCDPTAVNLSNNATQADTPSFAGYVSADAVRLTRVGDCEGTNNVISSRVYSTQNQSVPHGTGTTITFNSERYDYGELFDPTSSSSRLVAPVKGIYMITGHIQWTFNSSGTRIAGLMLNGTHGIASQLTFGSSQNSAVQSVSTTYELEVGDYIELSAYQASGGTINVVNVPGNSLSPELSMTLLHETE